MMPSQFNLGERGGFDAARWADRVRWIDAVNGAAVFLKSGAAKFPSLAGRRSAVGVIGASILRLPTATLLDRWSWIGGGVRLEADVFGQEVGVLAQSIA
jgi:hypothetical protein